MELRFDWSVADKTDSKNATRVPLSNNEAERTSRHAVMGRKNFYGSGNSSGAETAATLHTIIESCKENDIDPRSFILLSLRKVAAGEELETPIEQARCLRQHANEAGVTDSRCIMSS